MTGALELGDIYTFAVSFYETRAPGRPDSEQFTRFEPSSLILRGLLVVVTPCVSVRKSAASARLGGPAMSISWLRHVG